MLRPVWPASSASKTLCVPGPARARLKHESRRDGGMLAVRMDEEQIRDLLPEYPGLSAAVNGPQVVVVSGEQRVLDRVAEDLKDRRIAARKLPLSHQFNATISEPLLAAFRQCVEGVSLSPPRILLLSNLTGALPERRSRTRIIGAGSLSSLFALPTASGHWRKHAIDFWKLVHSRCCCCWPDGFSGKYPRFQSDGFWLPSLRKGAEDWAQILDTLAELYVAGLEIDWRASIATSAGCESSCLLIH